MALHPMNQANLAKYIPEIWAKEVQMAVEENLVFGAHVDRRYEKYASYGDTIIVPTLANLTATNYEANIDINLDATTQGSVNISIDKRYYIAFAVDDYTRIQDYPNYFDNAKVKVAYGLAHQIDDSLATLVPAFNTSNDVGTAGTALTADTLIAAYEALNEANAPMEPRVWILDPESITDLLKCDYFVRMDYTSAGVSERGFQGRQIFGAPVYMSTNVNANGSYHRAVYMAEEALALVMQMQPKIRVDRHALRQSDMVVAQTLYGVCEMRDTFGCQIDTRS